MKILCCGLPPCLLLGLNLAAEPPAPSGGPARDHHLFVGVDLFTQHDGAVATVVGFAGRQSVVLDAAGKPVGIDRDDGFRYRLAPKVSALRVQIDQLRVESISSSAEAAKREAIANQIGLLNHMSDRAHAATVRYAAPSDLPGGPPPTQLGRSGARSYLDPDSADSAGYSSDELATDFQAANVALDQVLKDSVRYVSDADSKTGGAGDADGLVLEFTVSSPLALPAAHAVVLCRVRDATGRLIDFSFARPLGPVDPQPRRIALEIHGLPRGFKPVESRVHIFDHGAELATSRSEKDVALTAAEAREYVLLDHLGTHRHDSAAAAVAWELAPPALLTATVRAELDFPTEVTLDAKGGVERIGRADDGRVMPPVVREILSELVYLPAIENGVAHPAVLAVNLADFAPTL